MKYGLSDSEGGKWLLKFTQNSEVSAYKGRVRREKFRAAFSFCITVLCICLCLSEIHLPIGKKNLMSWNKKQRQPYKGTRELLPAESLSLVSEMSKIKPPCRTQEHGNPAYLQVSRDFWYSGIEERSLSEPWMQPQKLKNNPCAEPFATRE